MDIAEYSLAELVDDPLVGLVMKSDGVNRAELKLLLERIARAIASALGGRPLSAPLLTMETARSYTTDRLPA